MLLIADFKYKNQEASLRTHLPAADVPDRVTDINRETSPPRSTPNEVNTVALENNWRVPETLEKMIPIPRSLYPHLKW